MNSITILGLATTIFLIECIFCWPMIENQQRQHKQIIQDIAIHQIKSCEFDKDCFECWRLIDKQLFSSSESYNGDIRMNHCYLPSSSSSIALESNEDEKKFCCQLWQTFDCRTNIGIKYCTMNGCIHYRRMLIDWANRLMSNNYCASDYQYQSEQCRNFTKQQMQQQLSKTIIFDEFDDVTQYM